MKLKPRLLVQSIAAFLALTGLLSAVFFVSIDRIRGAVFLNSAALGDSAAGISAYMLEVLHTEKISRAAIDTVLLLDERLGRIESHTRMAADIAGSIRSGERGWAPRPLPLVGPGEIPPPEPYLRLAPGVSLPAVRAEAELLANAAEMLRQITVVDWAISSSAINGESGFLIAMDAFPWAQSDYDPRGLHWYGRARDLGALYWTDVYEGRRGMGPIISCAVPFFDRSGGAKAFAGVARSTVRLADFSRIIDPTGIRRSGQFFILNRGGTVVYSTDGVEASVGECGALLGENFLESGDPRLRSLGLSMTLGATGMTELEIDGMPFYVAYAPIRSLGWSLGVTVPAQEIYIPAMQIEGQIWAITEATRASIGGYIRILAVSVALIILLLLPAIGFFAVRFTRAITGPVLALSEGALEVAGGNLGHEVSVSAGDELEQLASSFNAMTAQLRSHIAETARATAERQRIDTELDIATRIQASMLPANFPPFPGRESSFALYAEVHPAREVGGDFYDFFFIDDERFAALVADVSGKGMPAALFMASAKAVIKNRLQSRASPEAALELANRDLCSGNLAGMFVSAWVCVLDIPAGRLSYASAGHNPPLLLRAAPPPPAPGGAPGASSAGDCAGAGGEESRPSFEFLLSPPNLVLAGMEDTRYHCHETTIAEGDMLFLYTDGIVEAAGADGSFYGKERMKAFLDAGADLPLRDLLSGLRADVAAFADGAEQSDDITMLALRAGAAEPAAENAARPARAAMACGAAELSDAAQLEAAPAAGDAATACGAAGLSDAAPLVAAPGAGDAAVACGEAALSDAAPLVAAPGAGDAATACGAERLSDAAAGDGEGRLLRLKADISGLGALAGFVGRELEAAGCPARERGRVELAAEEIFVNIASYAYANGAASGAAIGADGGSASGADGSAAGAGAVESGEVSVACRTVAAPDRTEVSFAFSDRGAPFNPLEREPPDVTLPLEEREPGGLGILIARKLIDTISYSRENGANRLEFTKSWRKEEV